MRSNESRKEYFMADQMNTTNPIKLDGGARVAYDLMMEIAKAENNPHEPDPRTYYLTLYRQCFMTQHLNHSVEEILKLSANRSPKP